MVTLVPGYTGYASYLEAGTLVVNVRTPGARVVLGDARTTARPKPERYRL